MVLCNVYRCHVYMFFSVLTFALLEGGGYKSEKNIGNQRMSERGPPVPSALELASGSS